MRIFWGSGWCAWSLPYVFWIMVYDLCNSEFISLKLFVAWLSFLCRGRRSEADFSIPLHRIETYVYLNYLCSHLYPYCCISVDTMEMGYPRFKKKWSARVFYHRLGSPSPLFLPIVVAGTGALNCHPMWWGSNMCDHWPPQGWIHGLTLNPLMIEAWIQWLSFASQMGGIQWSWKHLYVALVAQDRGCDTTSVGIWIPSRFEYCRFRVLPCGHLLVVALVM
jgi:hypothetical protein